jgi:RNA binding exosome subunit
MAENDMKKIRKLESENSDVIWRDLDQCMGEDMVYFIRPQMQKLITQIKEIKK